MMFIIDYLNTLMMKRISSRMILNVIKNVKVFIQTEIRLKVLKTDRNRKQENPVAVFH